MPLPMEELPARIAATPALRRWGRCLDADVLLEVGAESWLLMVRDGQVLGLRPGPFVLPSFTLALRLDPAGFARFLAPEPPPGWHDLMALRRHGALRLEGDLVPFFAHLFWFKGALALLREGTGT